MTIYCNNEPEEIVVLLGQLLKPKSHVLDLGCGEGRNAIPLAKLGHHVEGWDKDAREIHLLNERSRMQNVKIKSLVCDMRDLRIEYDRWHAIITSFSMHFLQPEEAIERLNFVRSKIVPGGYHALAIFTDKGNLASLRNDRFFPRVSDLLEPYAAWEILSQTTGTTTCAKPGPRGEELINEYTTLLARKPL